MVVAWTGPKIHIEHLRTGVASINAVGVRLSTVLNLEKPGRFVGGTCTLGRDNSIPSWGPPVLLDGSGAALIYGSVIGDVRISIEEKIAVAGSTMFVHIMLWIRN